jgi:type II secretory pathway component HofQ
VARPIPIIQQALQVILDQVSAYCIPHHLVVVKATSNNERNKDDLAVVQQLSNHGDNFRSILDNMIELMKYSCKDEMEATEVSLNEFVSVMMTLCANLHQANIAKTL